MISAGGARGSGAWRSSEQGREPGCLRDPAHQQEEDSAYVSLLKREAAIEGFVLETGLCGCGLDE